MSRPRTRATRSGQVALIVLALACLDCASPPGPDAPPDAAVEPAAVSVDAPAPELAARVEALLSDLQVRERRSAAREALVALGADATPVLLEHFDDEAFVVRWEMVNLQGEIRDPRAHAALIDRALHDENSHVRWRSLWAITAQRDSAPFREEFHAAMTAEVDVVESWNAAVALSMLGDERCLDAIHRGLGDEDDWRRWEAINALGRVHDGASALALQPLLADASVRHRSEAVLALGRIGGEVAVTALRGALEDESPQVRWRAVMALGRMGDDRAAAWIRPLADDADELVRRQVEKALGRLGASRDRLEASSGRE